MKKILLGACVIFSAIFAAKAQLPYTQNFETTMSSTPAGWSVGLPAGHPGNAGWTFNNVYPVAGSSLWRNNVATHTYCAFVDDIDYNTTPSDDYDTLYTSSFSCSANAHVFISFDLNFNNYTDAEVGTLAYSTNGGVTWHTAATLPSGYGDISWHNGQVFDISSFVGGQTNVKLAFCWNNAGAVSLGYPGWGMGVDNIDVYAPLNYDLAVTSQNVSSLVQVGKSYTFTGNVFNYGGDSITAMTMNYSVNGNTAVTDNISSILLNSYATYGYSLSTPWVPSSAGTYTVKFWANKLNGVNVDQNHANDTLVATFIAIDSVQPKTVLFEEFNQASCDPCAEAKANIDSVCATNTAILDPVRLHVNWPGTDYMNDETQTPFIGTRVSYYSVNSVPDGKLDGMDIYPGYGYFGSSNVQAESAVGSAFKITITSALYTPSTNKFTVTANIKSYAAYAAGLSAGAYITVDTINYAVSQSTESIPQYNFPQVAEDMMPSASGTTLTAFTAGQTQTLTLSWTKNHAWGQDESAHTYDSSTCSVTIFVQDNSSKYIYQCANSRFSKPAGIESIGSGVSFEVYPNPTNSDANIAFSLVKDQNVTVEVYNTLGQNVYSQNEGSMASGQHLVTIPGSGLKSGMYFVKVTTDNGTSTQKLIIQK